MKAVVSGCLLGMVFALVFPAAAQEGAGGQSSQMGTSGQADASQQLIGYGSPGSRAVTSKAYGTSSADRSKATKIEQKSFPLSEFEVPSGYAKEKNSMQEQLGSGR